MLCLAVGLGILGFAAMRRAHRRCHGGGCGGYYYGGWDSGGWGHHHHRHHRRHWMLYSMLSRIDATPAQERTIVAELDKLRDRVGGAKDGLRDARGDLAAALRGPSLDDAALGAVLGRVDAATGEARTALLEAMRNIHGVLDDKQRSHLADLVDRGGGWRGWRGGPYR